MSSSKNLDTKTINKLKNIILEQTGDSPTDEELNLILKFFTVQEAKIIANPPLDINKYRKDKGAQAISITQISIDVNNNNLPSINYEWLVAYTDEKDLSQAISGFFEFLTLNSRDVSGSDQSDKIYNKTTLIERDYVSESYETYGLNLCFKNKGIPREYFCIRVYSNALSENKQVAVRRALQGLYV